MYKVTVLTNRSNVEIISTLIDLPPSESDQKAILSHCEEECYIDICRITDDGLSDTTNFRHSVEADLEPFMELEL